VQRGVAHIVVATIALIHHHVARRFPGQSIDLCTGGCRTENRNYRNEPLFVIYPVKDNIQMKSSELAFTAFLVKREQRSLP